MGYRNYFYSANKKMVDKVRRYSYEDLAYYLDFIGSKALDIEEYDGEREMIIDFFNMFNQKKIFEFGKLYWDDIAERIDSHGEPLFLNKDTQDAFCDYCPYIVTKEAVKEAIDVYQEKIVNYYKELVEYKQPRRLPFGFVISRSKKHKDNKLQSMARDQYFYWSNEYAVNLDEDSDSLTNSWMYEHEIFDLVRIYKTFDFENNYLLFYGY